MTARATAIVLTCSVEGCPHEAHHGGLCHGHEKQRARGQRLKDLGERIDGKGPKARFARLELAALKLADATEAPAGSDAREVYAKARDAYRKAVYRYFVDQNGGVRIETRDGRPVRRYSKDPK